MERRLAAILAADVVGYTRLMSADEAGMLQRLTELRQAVLDPLIAGHRGRVVKLIGDGVLAEFHSVVDAVHCAIAWQAAVEEHESEQAEPDRLAFRIGIHVGDILVEDDDIYGDGVNIAARLETLAEPRTICLSSDAFRQIRGKIDADAQDLGERQLKNVPEPIQVYRIGAERQSSGTIASHVQPLPLPDKPSIAVLPFENMSPDPEQEFFADGITEDIITELSRFPDLFVIARNSTFTYKGRSVKVQDVGRELGVAYVVEGSLRRAGSRVRIVVQLVDAGTGSHIWAERYDRELVDIFELQDEITEAIVGVLPGRVALAATTRLKRKRPDDMAAYDCILAGKIHHHRSTPEDNVEALRLLDRAIELDPEFAVAWAWRACTLGQALDLGYRDDPETVYRLAVEAVEKALSLNENDAECHRLLCEVNIAEHRLDQAQQHHEQAFRLNPNDARLVAQRGELLTWRGRPHEGVEFVQKAIRLDPFQAHKRAHLLGRALHAGRRYADAVAAFEQVPSPRYAILADLAACHARLNQADDAERLVAQVLRAKPDFSADAYVARLPYGQPGDRTHHREGLLRAGLPE